MNQLNSILIEGTINGDTFKYDAIKNESTFEIKNIFCKETEHTYEKKITIIKVVCNGNRANTIYSAAKYNKLVVRIIGRLSHDTESIVIYAELIEHAPKR